MLPKYYISLKVFYVTSIFITKLKSNSSLSNNSGYYDKYVPTLSFENCLR